MLGRGAPGRLLGVSACRGDGRPAGVAVGTGAPAACLTGVALVRVMRFPDILEALVDRHLEYVLAVSTLAELREVVTASADLPDTAVVRARVGFGNLNGAKIRKIRIGVEKPDHE